MKPEFKLGQWYQVAVVDYREKENGVNYHRVIVVDRCKQMKNILEIHVMSAAEGEEHLAFLGTVTLDYPSLTIIGCNSSYNLGASYLLDKYVAKVWDRIVEQIELRGDEDE
ncbi:hypothetical protein [Infirmifilum sp.]|uniref:hypothetical protein n=1 Tax=Infirmifilum sp. TaxID=2856575 RepID=UPI003D0EE171